MDRRNLGSMDGGVCWHPCNLDGSPRPCGSGYAPRYARPNSFQTNLSGDPCRNDGEDISTAIPPEPLNLWEEEIRPLSGCHPALIQIAADAHWNACFGHYAVDTLAVTLRVREFLEDFWAKCSEDKTTQAILLRAAAGQTPNPGFRTAELMQRGLLTPDLQLFSLRFQQVIVDSLPRGKSLLQAAKDCEQEPGAVLRFLERWLPWVERFLKIRNSFKGKDDDKEGKF